MSAGDIMKLHGFVREVLEHPPVVLRALMGKRVEVIFYRLDDARTWNAMGETPAGITHPEKNVRGRKISNHTAPHNCFYVHAGNKRFYYGRKYRETVLEGDE